MRLVKNTIYNVSISVINFLCGIVLSVIIARRLLPEKMGTYSYYMWLLSVVITFSSLGIPNTLTKYVAQFFLVNKNYIFSLIKELLKYQVLLFVIACLAILIGLKNLPFIMLMFLLALFFNLVNSCLRSYCAGIQKFFELSLSSFFTTGLEVIIIFVLLSFFNEWWIVFAIHIFIVILHTTVLYFLLRKDLNFLKQQSNSSHQLQKAKIREYLLLISLMIVADTIVWQRSEVFFLKIYSSMKDVAFYSIAFSLAYLPLKFITAPIGSVLMPYISTLYGKDDLENSKLTCYHTMRYIIIILLPIVAFCFMFSNHIVKLLYGVNYIKSADVLKILLVSAFVGGVAVPTSALVQAFEMMKFAVSINISVGIVNIVLDILLIPSYSIIGAAFANAISQIIGCLLGFIWLYFKLKMKYPLKELFFSLLIVVPLAYLISNFTFRGFFSLILYFVIFFVLYLLIMFLTKQIKFKELIEIFKRWKQKY